MKAASKTNAPAPAQPKKRERRRQAFGICPICRKNDGFYVFFEPGNGNGKSEYRLRLGCPKCKRMFQPGLVVEAAEKKKK